MMTTDDCAHAAEALVSAQKEGKLKMVLKAGKNFLFAFTEEDVTKVLHHPLIKSLPGFPLFLYAEAIGLLDAGTELVEDFHHA